MAEAIMHAEIQRKIANDINQNDLSESVQQMVELQPLVSSQPSDLSSNYLQQQQQQVNDETTMDIKEMIQDCEDGLLLKECCIYQVPITLHHLKEEAYTPKVVSIGPFHHGNKRLRDMERHKRVLFKRFTKRTTSSLDDLVRFIKCLLPKVRASYSETIEPITEQQLLELTLMDAGFIIELFITSWIDEGGKDAKLSQPWLDYSIHRDLILLENQLPFFVIEELFDKAVLHNGPCSLPSFLMLTYEYFGHFNIQKLKSNSNVKIKHFTDLLRLFYLPKQMCPRLPFTEGGSHILLYDANALQEAGIKFKANKSKCLLDLEFSGHQLEIPQILVDDGTEILFRNMIALEQCHYHHDSYVTDYALMLDYLVGTYKDVDLLVHSEIVINNLGDSNNVALLFNGLGENVIQMNFNSKYHCICKRLNEYCQGRWHMMKATLRRDYCRTPWQIVASTAAIVLLLLTAVQTIFSILQVVKK